MQYQQLPTTPNLEHLKSQAKQLLKARKAGALDPFQRIRTFFPKLADATDAEIQDAAFGLQDAQLVIAREYGFASWTRLADVHRNYRVDIAGEILDLTPLTYTQKLASLFPDKPFERIIEVLSAGDVI